MRFCYADPPYIGQAKKHYSHDAKCDEVDHAELLRIMLDYDGGALSCSVPSLGYLLGLCGDLGISPRILSWVKPFAVYKPHVSPAYSWEPVLLWGARKRSRKEPTPKDSFIGNCTFNKGLVGAKPKDFCFWIFDCWNVKPGDSLCDMFPGTGIVSWCWSAYQAGQVSAVQLDLFA
jgi:hypothetical protein